MVRHYDADHNGSIDYQEWLRTIDDYVASKLTTQEIQAIAAAREWVAMAIKFASTSSGQTESHTRSHPAVSAGGRRSGTDQNLT